MDGLGGLNWAVQTTEGRRSLAKVDGPKDSKWTSAKVDGPEIKKWTVLKSESGRSKMKKNWMVHKRKLDGHEG